MYSLLISTAAALLVGVGGALLDLWGWLGGLLLGFLAFALAWVLIGLFLRRRLQPALERVKRQVEGGMLEPARQSLEAILPLGRWLPLLSGQIHAQIGAIAHAGGNQDQALEHLAKASRRVGDAQLLRACILHRRGDKPEALKVLQAAAPFNRRHSLLANTHAYLLHKAGQNGEAMARLARFLRKEAADPNAKDNLLRLQNGRRMNMHGFGAEWFALGLERAPASMGQMRTARKGFRQPPKRK